MVETLNPALGARSESFSPQRSRTKRSLSRQSSLPIHHRTSHLKGTKLRGSRKWILWIIGFIILILLLVRRQNGRSVVIGGKEKEMKVELTTLSPISTVSKSQPKILIPSSPVPSSNRYLSYSPHSGYHNQRISLENALTLAFMLKRTLILPPIWLGHAIPYISYDKLQRRLAMASKHGLIEGCLQQFDLITRECEGFWEWTVMDWSFLIDLKEIKTVEMIPRFNMTESWLVEELGLKKKSDIYELKDDTMYQYRFYDSKADHEPLDKYETRIDVEKLAIDSKDSKLLSVGTLFGTSRIRATTEENGNARSSFRRATMFKNKLLDRITESIRDLLGGNGNYYGLHLRVGDGEFQMQAEKNTRDVWTKLCVDKMKLDRELCKNIGNGEFSKYQTESPEDINQLLFKRANSQPQKGSAFHHAPLPKLKLFKSRKDSPLASTLKCRGELHTQKDLLPFNAPLFIATDSKIPTIDQNLAVFFHAFPCTFILSDFSSESNINSMAVEGFDELAELINEKDSVSLAQFLYPILDAQIAAYGRGLLGTPESTFSRFAVDVLHQVYHGWDVISRG